MIKSIRRKKISVGSIILHLALILLSLSFVLPLLTVISVSFTNEDVLREAGYSLIPKKFDIAGYQYIFANPMKLVDAYLVTIFESAVATILSLIVMSALAYALSRKNFLLKKPITYYLLFTMLFSGGMVPSYIINTQYLNLSDSLWVYILPFLVSAWHVVIIRTFFQGLPDALVESAKIDGASELRIFAQIVIPLSKPVLATIGLMVLLGRWNEWYNAFLYIRDERLFTLQYLLQKMLLDAEFAEQMSMNMPGNMTAGSVVSVPSESMRFAMCVLAGGPTMLVFPFFQKYFVKGLTVGAVKG